LQSGGDSETEEKLPFYRGNNFDRKKQSPAKKFAFRQLNSGAVV
jgi:hypothetical protein